MRSAEADGLAARRGGDVEDAIAGLRIERDHHGLTALILGRDPPVADEFERAEVTGMPNEKCVGHERRGLDFDTEPLQLGGRLPPRSCASGSRGA